MKKILVFLFLLIGFLANAQHKGYLKYDSLYVGRDGEPSELILLNKTKDTSGFLFNKGNGRTEFKRALTTLNDSSFLIGLDTLKTKAVPTNLEKDKWNEAYNRGDHNGKYVLLNGSYSNPDFITELTWDKIIAHPDFLTAADTIGKWMPIGTSGNYVPFEYTGDKMFRFTTTYGDVIGISSTNNSFWMSEYSGSVRMKSFSNEVIVTGSDITLRSESILYPSFGKGLMYIDNDFGNMNTIPNGVGFLKNNGAGVWTFEAGTGSGFTNPMTTAGDLIVGGTSGAATRLSKGASNYVLTTNVSGNVVWGPVPVPTFSQVSNAGATWQDGMGNTISYAPFILYIADGTQSFGMKAKGNVLTHNSNKTYWLMPIPADITRDDTLIYTNTNQKDTIATRSWARANAQGGVGGSVPTLQQVIAAGNTLVDNSIAFGDAAYFQWTDDEGAMEGGHNGIQYYNESSGLGSTLDFVSLMTTNRTLKLPDVNDTLANRAWVRGMIAGGGTDLSGYYTKINLQTSGQAVIDPNNITQDATHRFATDAEKTTWNAKQTALNGTGLVRMSGATPSYDNTSYAPLASPTFTGTVVLPSTTSIGSVSNTEIGYVDGVTSGIQSQLNGKQGTLTLTTTGTSGAATLVGDTLNIPNYSSGTAYTDEQAQDAVGAIISSEFTYNDATPLLAINTIAQSKVTGLIAALGAKADSGSVELNIQWPLKMIDATTIGITQADATHDGFLDSADHVKFSEAYNKYTVSGSYASGAITYTRKDGTTYSVTGLPTGTGTTYTFNSSSIVNSANNLALSGDASTPGNNKVYGTNASGVKGYQSAAVMNPTGLATNDMLVYNGTEWVNKTTTQVTALLNSFTSTLKGLVPASGGGTTNFLRADGQWVAPPSGTTYTFNSSSIVNTTGNLALSGDAATPGNNKVYGTNSTGTKGYQSASIIDMTGFTTGDVVQYDGTGFAKLTLPVLSSGTYSPTSTRVLNLDGSTINSLQYLRVGSVVTVSGQLLLDATATGSEAQFRISLPATSNFTDVVQLGGTFNAGSFQDGGSIEADITNDQALFKYVPTTTGTVSYFFTFTYRIL